MLMAVITLFLITLTYNYIYMHIPSRVHPLCLFFPSYSRSPLWDAAVEPQALSAFYPLSILNASSSVYMLHVF